MIKNYKKSSFEGEKNNGLKPKEETISFLINYSKSFSIEKRSKVIENIRLDNN